MIGQISKKGKKITHFSGNNIGIQIMSILKCYQSVNVLKCNIMELRSIAGCPETVKYGCYLLSFMFAFDIRFFPKIHFRL